MSRLVRVGAGGKEISWHNALNDLRADDVLLLEPGFYEIPAGIFLSDITIKGTGNLPEDTTILGYLNVDAGSQFVNLENLCVNTVNDANSLFIPAEANTFLSLRNCIVKGFGGDTATIAANGKVTLELFSTVIMNGSVSLFADSNFRLEMNDSTIKNVVRDIGALALEGQGTAIINNSRIHGSIDTFKKSNVELDINNTVVSSLLIQGQAWVNMLNSKLLSQEDTGMFITEETWINIIGSEFKGGFYCEKSSHIIIQNSRINRLIATGEAKITLNNSVIANHADFQNEVECNSRRVTFNGGNEYEYFLALSDQAQFEGHDLIFNSNGANLAVENQAHLHASVIATSDDSITVECGQNAEFRLWGMKWTTKKN